MHRPTLPDRELRARFARWQTRGWLRPLDAAFADWLGRKAPDAPPELILCAALVSHQIGRGHTCLDLEALLHAPEAILGLPPDGNDPDHPARWLSGHRLEAWRARLDFPDLVGHAEGGTPLVLCANRLYLRRYWRHEQTLARAIAARLGPDPGLAPEATIRPILDALFPTTEAIDWQKIACAVALRQRFALITGGPGTGKTTTVVRLLALLQALALKHSPARPLNIGLAAPTGKAAARLAGAIARARDSLPEIDPEIDLRAAIPIRALTLHRLLGSRPDARGFKHHAGRPLALDVLVIDEASMVDLELMAAVFDALPASARLVLLGDKDQLASVEAGALLGELAQRAEGGHYLPKQADWLEAVSGQRLPKTCIDAAGRPHDQAVAMLRYSHRFSAGSGIGRLARAVNAGDADAVEAILAAGAEDLNIHLSAPLDALREAVLAGKGDWPGYRHYLERMHATRPAPAADAEEFDAWARGLLHAHARFQVLCALRQGPWGVEGLNEHIAGWLHAASLIPAVTGWYPGRPVLITRNEYALGLMNGDIGLTLPWPEGASWGLRVAFAAEEGGVRWVRPARLTSIETVYALTVHKSQGSEFDHVALVLAESMRPPFNRELLYTGLTRARQRLSLIHPGAPGLLRAMVEHKAPRASGLMQALEALQARRD